MKNVWVVFLFCFVATSIAPLSYANRANPSGTCQGLLTPKGLTVPILGLSFLLGGVLANITSPEPRAAQKVQELNAANPTKHIEGKPQYRKVVKLMDLQRDRAVGKHLKVSTSSQETVPSSDSVEGSAAIETPVKSSKASNEDPIVEIEKVLSEITGLSLYEKMNLFELLLNGKLSLKLQKKVLQSLVFLNDGTINEFLDANKDQLSKELQAELKRLLALQQYDGKNKNEKLKEFLEDSSKNSPQDLELKAESFLEFAQENPNAAIALLMSKISDPNLYTDSDAQEILKALLQVLFKQNPESHEHALLLKMYQDFYQKQITWDLVKGLLLSAAARADRIDISFQILFEKVVVQESDFSYWKLAIQSIGRIEDTKATNFLLQQFYSHYADLRNPKKTQYPYAVLRTLVSSRDPRVVDIVNNFAYDSNKAVLDTIAAAFSKRGWAGNIESEEKAIPIYRILYHRTSDMTRKWLAGLIHKYSPDSIRFKNLEFELGID